MEKNKRKQEIITFKVDESLAQALKNINNRSEFIRSAILTVLDNTCPLCKGTGVLRPDQRKQWKVFSQQHTLVECENCNSMHLECHSKDATKEECRKCEAVKLQDDPPRPPTFVPPEVTDMKSNDLEN